MAPKKIAIAIGCLVLLVSTAAFAWHWHTTHRKPDVTYKTAQVERRRIAAKVTASGTLSALVTVQVGAQVSGRISKLNADFNSVVTKGELIAELDPALYQASLDQAQANYEQAVAAQVKSRAASSLADKQLARTRSLHDQGLAAAQDVDTAVATADQAHGDLLLQAANVDQARASLNQARVNLSYCKIYSPIDGVVISRSVDVGQTVAASLQAPVLFTIAENLKRMQVDTNVSEGDVGRLKEGMSAYFTVDAYPGKRFRGVIGQIRNAATNVQNVVTYDAVIKVDNDQLELRPGMTANVTIVYADRNDAIALPNTALRFHPPDAVPENKPHGKKHDGQDETRTVYVVRSNGAAAPVSIHGGVSDGVFTEVVDGDVHEGDAVAVDLADNGTTPTELRCEPVRWRRRGRRRTPDVLMSLVHLDAIEKTYGSGDAAVHALRGVSLRIEQGEFVAIMGASGSGKSTLMNVLGCLDRPTRGTYTPDGRETSRMTRNELAVVRNRVLGFVFQSFNLLPRTSALENVELPLLYAEVAGRERHRRARESLDRVGLASRLDHHPNQLSGGQQQRVAIARALVTEPKVILADEPTGNLDSRTSIEVMALFQELGKGGITVIVVTHEPDIAEYASRVIVVRDGLVQSDERQSAKQAYRLAPAPTVEGAP